MGEMRLDCGSELHLLRYLGRHRNALDRAVLAETHGDAVDWRDFNFTPGRATQFDAEIFGLDFLFSADESGLLSYRWLREEWASFWPQTRNPQSGKGRHNWDAVGVLRTGQTDEWLLVEAKANLKELRGSPCGAVSQKSKNTIRTSFELVSTSIELKNPPPWTRCYYQYANRLAALWFLLNHGIPARLLYIYFLGDENEGEICPADRETWESKIREQDETLGLNRATNWELLGSRVHKVFLDVRGRRCPPPSPGPSSSTSA